MSSRIKIGAAVLDRIEFDGDLSFSRPGRWSALHRVYGRLLVVRPSEVGSLAGSELLQPQHMQPELNMQLGKCCRSYRRGAPSQDQGAGKPMPLLAPWAQVREAAPSSPSDRTKRGQQFAIGFGSYPVSLIAHLPTEVVDGVVQQTSGICKSNRVEIKFKLKFAASCTTCRHNCRRGSRTANGEPCVFPSVWYECRWSTCSVEAIWKDPTVHQHRDVRPDCPFPRCLKCVGDETFLLFATNA